MVDSTSLNVIKNMFKIILTACSKCQGFQPHCEGPLHAPDLSITENEYNFARQ